MTSFIGTKYFPGIRRNNPTNIRATDDKWAGKIGTDNGFVVFASIEQGIRAAFINMDTHIRSGKDTIRELVPTWAPPKENNTAAYIKDVSSWAGMNPDAKIPRTRDAYERIIKAIIRQENTPQHVLVTDAMIEAGIEGVLSTRTGFDFLKKKQ